jgi:hypothetical protein
VNGLQERSRRPFRFLPKSAKLPKQTTLLAMFSSLIKRLVALFAILSPAALHATPEQDFWKWFVKNEASLWDFEKNQEQTFDRLNAEMHRINPSLTFEFGPKENGKREFVISADGIRDAFPAVEALYAAAPVLPRWTIVKFRPRRKPFDIEYSGIKVHAKDVRVTVRPSAGKADLVVFLPGYSNDQRNKFLGVTFLLLDQALGEYDVEMKVGAIDEFNLDAAPADAITLEELPKAFDKFFQRH